jgi:dienelactone hydrolase
MRSRTDKFRLLAWALLLVPVLVGLLYPIAQNYLRAASVLARLSDPNARGWIANYDVHPVDARDETFDFNGKPTAARVYSPRGVGFAPGIVVVHGMHELGISEPRLVSFARSLAASGFVVMTPQVQGLAEYRVEAESAEVIGAAAQFFAQRLEVSKVGVLGISFSGGLALVAATDARYGGSIAWIAAVGAHYDLAHVLHFYATGEAERPDGSFEHFTPHEYGPLIVVLDRPGDFFPAQDVAKATEAIKLVLADEGKKSEALTAQMTPAGQEVMQRIYHQQLDSFRQAILGEIDKDHEQLAAASPAGRLGFLHAPVLLLHGSDDTVIPPTELLWLKQRIPQQYLVEALVSPAISHVDVGHKASFREQFALVHWMEELIREARNAPRAQSAELPAGAWVLLPACSRNLKLSW